ncbi:phosphotransferase [Paenibacillus cellulositrophicus]|uniref:phosphotransferase enzyme family protein n=1 Tax=Paenibacillus cellulositrophicus TaxID=562959 RepID=UPI00203A6EE5|nr:phosphotransferase [Paenibacillus cellulositrophicus]MCM3001851.1 phosphotransferase [Paenibacillus cellulositrophicus]
MNEAFGANSEDSLRLLLVQAEQVLMSALEKFGIKEEQAEFIQISDHITYRVSARSGGKFLLRIHPVSADVPAIRSEMMWLNWLSSQGLPVPEGIADQEGNTVAICEADRSQGWPVTLLRWIEGQQAEGGLDDRQVYRMGVLMARLHQAAQSFVPPEGFVRPEWGAASLTEDMQRLERRHRAFLSSDEWALYVQAADLIKGRIAAWPPGPSRYGLIHADLHEGNVVFKDGEPCPIDFGRCGFGYYAYDLAQALIGLYPAQRSMLLDGYESMRLLPKESVSMMETFFLQAVLENQAFHAGNPQEIPSLKEQKGYILSAIRSYLAEEPFLFPAK